MTLTKTMIYLKERGYLTELGETLIDKNINIITHDGLFHADEVISISLLRVITSQVNVVRTRNIPTKLNGNITVILDIGGKFVPEDYKFDHHQGTNLEATNVLLCRSIFKGEFLKYVLPFMTEISDIDRGLKTALPTQLNAIIRSFNGLDKGFDKSLLYGDNIIEALFTTIKMNIEGEKLWNKLERDGKNGLIKFTREVIPFIPNWKDLAKRDGVMYFISRNESGYTALTLDQVNYPLDIYEEQVFRHKAGFMATYKSLEDALKCTRKDLKVTQNLMNHY